MGCGAFILDVALPSCCDNHEHHRKCQQRHDDGRYRADLVDSLVVHGPSKSPRKGRVPMSSVNVTHVPGMDPLRCGIAVAALGAARQTGCLPTAQVSSRSTSGQSRVIACKSILSCASCFTAWLTNQWHRVSYKARLDFILSVSLASDRSVSATCSWSRICSAAASWPSPSTEQRERATASIPLIACKTAFSCAIWAWPSSITERSEE